MDVRQLSLRGISTLLQDNHFAHLGSRICSQLIEVDPTGNLLANYPNPFNPETWIPYQLVSSSDVEITIYDTKGHLIRTLALGHQEAGYYRDRHRAAYWNGLNSLGEQVASGVYFYQLRTDAASEMRKMVILK